MDDFQHNVFVAQDLMEDILSNSEVYFGMMEQLSEEALVFDDEEAEDDFRLLCMIAKLLEIEDAEAMIESLLIIFQYIETSRILRPYSQHFTTSEGCNRVTWENVDIKYTNDIFKIYFRFEKCDIPLLIEALQIPERISFDGYLTTSLEALLLVLRRLSSHVRYIDISMEFDLLPQFQSTVFNGLCMFIFEKIKDPIRRINHSFMTDRTKLEMWAAALEAKGCPLPNTFGYGDGCHIPVCKPVRGQRSWFCGHHRVHCFKILGLIVPSGLLFAFGPFGGPTHDSTAANIVGLDLLLEEHYTFPDGTSFNVFLDPAFAVGDHTVTPVRRTRDITEAELAWNRRMCRDRIVVEWGFGKVKNIFRMIDNEKNMKALMSPVAVYTFLAIHLTNIHSILYGNQVSQYFGVEVESLDTYLAEFNN